MIIYISQGNEEERREKIGKWIISKKSTKKVEKPMTEILGYSLIFINTYQVLVKI